MPSDRSPTVASPLAELSKRLAIPDWQTRSDGNGIVLVAGARGVARQVSGALLLILRPAASAAVRGLQQQLVAAGLLTVGRDGLILARLPDEAEAAKVRELLGLHGGWVK